MPLLTREKGNEVNYALLSSRIGSGHYGISKWIRFCHYFMKRGYKVTLYEARATKSKYVTIHGLGDDFYTVRFSDHKPNRARELRGDCDFFVGITHTGVRTFNDAILATIEHFGDGGGDAVRKLVEEETHKMEKEEFRGAAGPVHFSPGGSSLYN